MPSSKNRKQRRRASHSSTKSKPPSPLSSRRADIGPYIAFLLIWVFAAFLLYLTVREYAPLLTTALAAGFGLYVLLCTANAYLGRPLFGWQRGLARGPLLLVGGGRTQVASIKGTGRGKAAIGVAAVLAAILVAATVWLAVRV